MYKNLEFDQKHIIVRLCSDLSFNNLFFIWYTTIATVSIVLER